MVDPAVLPGTFNGPDIRRFLHRADNTRVAAGIGADPAELRLGQVEAPGTGMDPVGKNLQGLGQATTPLAGLLQQVVRQPQRRLLADAGQAGQLGGQVVDGRHQDPGRGARAAGRGSTGALCLTGLRSAA